MTEHNDNIEAEKLMESECREECCCNHEHKHEHEADSGISGCGCGHCHDHESEDEEEGGLAGILIALCLFVLGMICSHFNFFEEIPNLTPRLVGGLLFLGSYMFCGRPVVLSAARNLSKKDFFDEKFLMTVASLGACALGEFSEAVAVMLFYQIGEYFQDYAIDKSRDSIKALMKICPDKANVLRDGKIVEVEAVQVQIGETVVVKPGERIPVDAVVTKGKTFIDNSTLTGESVPVEVFENSEVYSGSVNKNAVIELKCIRQATDSAASRIISLVQESSQRKAKTEHFITRFSKIYTPVVCVLSLLVVIVPTAVQGLFGIGTEQGALGIERITSWNWSEWFYRALSFLVVSCPCAVVISVPLAFFGGIGAASKNGILIKGSSSLESLAGVKTCVFDKTGTITKGVFSVSEIHPSSESRVTKDELLMIATHAEYYSNHPLSKSLKLAHNDECCAKISLKDAEELSGHGIKVCLDGKTVLCGNEKLMKLHEVSGFSQNQESFAGTVIHVAQDGVYLGRIVIADEVKEDSKKAIAQLRKFGVKKIVMLTGDSETSAKKVCEEVGIDQYYSNLLPSDKVSKVESLLSEGTLAFTGDGINDAPVLARSDVGIAMGGLGADAAIESADVVIMNDELSKLPKAILVARRTLAVVKQNVAFSIGVKLAIMVSSAFGLTNMWFAVFGDVGVSLLAVLNAMRMLKMKV